MESHISKYVGFKGVFMWETVLAVRHHGCPVSDVSREFSELQLQNISKSELSDNRSKRILCLRGETDTVEAFATAFSSRDRVSLFEEFGREEGRAKYYTTRIEYDPKNPSIAQIVNRNECFQHNTVNVRKGIEHWTVYSEQKSAVQRVVDEIRKHENEVVVHRSVDCTDVASSGSMKFASLHEELTTQQRLVFQTALETGYYENGSDVTMETIGDELDLHSSTAWEHLSKAENTILTEIGVRIFPH